MVFSFGICKHGAAHNSNLVTWGKEVFFPDLVELDNTIKSIF